MWVINPEFEATIIALSPDDQRRVDEWLTAQGHHLSFLPETGRPMTACRRNFVHLRVALYISGRLPERLAVKSVRSAIHRDVKWYARRDALKTSLPAWNCDLDGLG